MYYFVVKYILWIIVGALSVYGTASLSYNLFQYFNKPSTVEVKNLSEPLCKRTDPYDMPEEFKRSLSLLKQRNEVDSTNKTAQQKEFESRTGEYLNCLKIEYDDLSKYGGAEGVFLFDDTSKPDELKIYVDTSYKSYDDLLTAILLSHEVFHVNQYLKNLLGIESLSCVDEEVYAFQFQYYFIKYGLNEEEKSSLVSRIEANPDKNNAYKIITDLARMNEEAYNSCNGEGGCTVDRFEQSLRDMIMRDPDYQKQCHL